MELEGLEPMELVGAGAKVELEGFEPMEVVGAGRPAGLQPRGRCDEEELEPMQTPSLPPRV